MLEVILSTDWEVWEGVSGPIPSRGWRVWDAA